MKALHLRLLVVFLTCAALSAAPSAALAAVGFTADFNDDYTVDGVNPKPGVTIIDSAAQWGYGINAEPMATATLVDPTVYVPTGFHVSRIAIYYDCATDTLYVGYDVSNRTQTSDGTPVPEGYFSRAWDADGDGDPCTISNTYIKQTVRNNMKDRVPAGGNTEKYEVDIDLNGDGVNDWMVFAYDNGLASNGGGNPCKTSIDGPSPPPHPPQRYGSRTSIAGESATCCRPRP